MSKKSDGFCELLEHVQGEQLERREQLGSDGWGDGDGERAPRAGATRPQRQFVVFEDLWDTSGKVDWKIQISRTMPAEVPSQACVFDAAKAEAGRVMAVFLASQAAMSNTAVKFTLHHAEVTVFEGWEQVLHLLAVAMFPDFIGFTDDPLKWFEEVGPAKFYGRLLRGPCGLFVRCENKVGPAHVSIEFKGEAFETYGMAPFARFMASVHDSGVRWHATRLDCAWDGADFSPKRVYAALKRGHFRSLAQRDTVQLRETPFGDDAGQTVYLGKRGSADYLRVYDRRETGTRVEHECRKGRAKLLGLMLIHTPLDRWHEVAMGNLRDFVDFVKRSPGENVTRSKPLKFWSIFVGQVERMQVRMGDLASTVKTQSKITTQKLQSVVKAISRRVNTLARGLGWDVFKQVMHREEIRLRPSDLSRIEDVKLVLSSASQFYEVTVEEIMLGGLAWSHGAGASS
jgi:hypothetical protein